MAGTDKNTEQPLEEVFGRLDEVVKELEEGSISLEQSFQLYHEGMDLLKICNDKIETIEKQIIVLDEDGGEHEF